MRIPAIKGVIDRRILANYRIAPEVMAAMLPQPLRPKIVAGYAIGGICLIRLKHVRPKFLPIPWGIGSENAAHRMAVEWDAGGQTREGVYIPRRDSDSRFNALVGGRLFPGIHHHARFIVRETADCFSVSVQSDDGQTRVHVSGRVGSGLPSGSVFASLAEASEFFERGALGYSATRDPGRMEGLELCCTGWKVEPLDVQQIESSYFENPAHFPPGSAQFDCALLMRGIRHEWHSREELCCSAAQCASARA